MEKALGKCGLQAARVCLSLAHWQFSVGQVTFTLKSLQSTIGSWVGHQIPLWVFGICIVILYSPLVWIRRIEPLSKLLVFAALMILVGVVTTSAFALGVISDQDGHAEGYEPLNPDGYWGTIGFAFFMYEGIGSLLPVMRETEKPEIAP